LGGEVFLAGDKVRYRIPSDCPEAEEIISELRKDRQALVEYLQDRASKAPSLDEVEASVPPGVKVVSYRPREAPFAVAPVSVVTNAGKFYRRYLADLGQRIGNPVGYSCPPLADILAKLAEGGLEVRVETPQRKESR
jgi:hypothetical protein